MKTSITACIFAASVVNAGHQAHQHLHAHKRDVQVVTEVEVVKETAVVYQTVWVYPDGSPVTMTWNVVQQQANEPETSSAKQTTLLATTTAAAKPTSAAQNTPAATSAPRTTSAAPVSSTAPSSGSGQTFVGDMTYYDVGLGSCGWTNTPDQAVVAVPWQQMNNGANPNNNPLCGKTVTISYNGKTKTAMVVDTCGGCSTGDLDMSTSLFSYFADMSLGRVPGMSWSFNS